MSASPDRHAVLQRGRDPANQLASRLPLVHRTGMPGQKRPWIDIFSRGHLDADRVGSDLERELGYERAVYFFTGCGAYPRGSVALLIAQTIADNDKTTFTPFDTGAMAKFLVRPSPAGVPAVPFGDAEKRRTLEEHLGRGADLSGFAGSYLASHFHDPREYVTRGRHSEPDFPAYHGLVSTTGDRRAWTLEIQHHRRRRAAG